MNTELDKAIQHIINGENEEAALQFSKVIKNKAAAVVASYGNSDGTSVDDVGIGMDDFDEEV